MTVRRGILGLAVVVGLACVGASSKGERSQAVAGALELAARDLTEREGADSTRFGAPFLVQRDSLGPHTFVDLIGASTRTIDGIPRSLVISTPSLGPTIATRPEQFAAVLEAWWPATQAQLMRVCAIAASSSGGPWGAWSRWSIVSSRESLPDDLVIGDSALLMRLENPTTSGLTDRRAEVHFWVVRPGASAKLRCDIERRRFGGRTMNVHLVDSIPGMGFARLGG